MLRKSSPKVDRFTSSGVQNNRRPILLISSNTIRYDTIQEFHPRTLVNGSVIEDQTVKGQGHWERKNVKIVLRHAYLRQKCLSNCSSHYQPIFDQDSLTWHLMNVEKII